MDAITEVEFYVFPMAIMFLLKKKEIANFLDLNNLTVYHRFQ